MSKHRIVEFVLDLVVVVMLCAVAQAEKSPSYQALVEDANEQSREFLDSLAGKMDSPDQCYDLIKRRLLEGHFGDVKAALDLRDQNGERIFADYRFARL